MRQALKALITVALLAFAAHANAQPLSLDSCRKLALANNKSLAISRAKSEKALYDYKSARTNYLPKVSAIAGSVRTGSEISLLSDRQKGALGGLGVTIGNGLGNAAQQIVQANPDLAPLIQQVGQHLPQLETALNNAGRQLADAFRTDTRNMAIGAVMLTQPLYMGGKIRAYDHITRYAQDVAAEQLRADGQQVILDADQAYWQVVSLANKRKLALKYRDMLAHLDEDMQKMIREGVATKANGLSVSVKLNEAEMALTKVENGLTLSQMLLCQVCGLPLDSPVEPVDAQLAELPALPPGTEPDTQTALASRPELRQLQTAVDIYKEKVNIERAAFLPQLALSAGYLTTNPGLTNGFENKFRGTWNVGVTLSLPIWNWGDGRYKVRGAKAEAQTAAYELADAREKIELQVKQATFRVSEADKQYNLSLKNLEKAEENLRTAEAGFREGVVVTSDLLAAQSAWMHAHNEKIDAQIDARLTRSTLGRAAGTLGMQP